MNGIFMDGSITGIGYRTESHCGQLDEAGCFSFREGESIVFFIGSLFLGSCRAKEVITPLDWVCEAQGRHEAVSHYQVQNTARLLLSLGKIDDAVRDRITEFSGQIHFVQEPANFEADPVIRGILESSGCSLIPAARARNLVRRCHHNIRKESNVRIPTRDGSYVMATVYRPLTQGRYPVVMSMGAWGRDFIMGFAGEDPARAELLEEAEDRFYDDYGNVETKRMLQRIFFDRLGACFASLRDVPNPDPAEEIPSAPSAPPAHLVPISEAFEQPCAMDWVPFGYCVINVDERGVGDSPEKCALRQFGNQNALDYYDAIEWASNQPWSSGKIGLFGASYYAMTQYQVAWRKPRGLTAMIPVMGDWDSYRDYMYSGGGLLNIADNMALSDPAQDYTLMNRALEHPFREEDIYGPYAEYMATCPIDQIDIPIFPCTEPDASLHGKGSSEAFINCPSPNKKFIFINSCGIHFWIFHPEHIARFRAFFDHWLKGIDNGIMEEPRVDLQIRCGGGTYLWRREADWPVPGTVYRKFYLTGNLHAQQRPDLYEAEPSADLFLTNTVPAVSGRVSYPADVFHRRHGRVPGVTFLSEPFEEDIQLAGYIKAGLYVASTTSDMEIHMRVRVLDESGREVNYTPQTTMEPELPLGFGELLVSHRRLDESRSREDLPVYQHTREAWQPLAPEEIVYCEVGTFPTSGLIRKGWRLRLDIDPVNRRWVNYQEAEYRKGSINRIYFGGDYPSFVQIPVLPPAESHPSAAASSKI